MHCLRLKLANKRDYSQMLEKRESVKIVNLKNILFLVFDKINFLTVYAREVFIMPL